MVNISKWGFSILQVEAESTCNMRCKFCPYPIRPDKGIRLADKYVFDIIDSLEADGALKYICFNCFNETLLDERIYDFVKYTKNKGFAAMVITNGLLFRSQEVINRLVESAPDIIKISFQTANPLMFRSARGINVDFQEYKNGIFEFLRAISGKSPVVTIDLACNFLSLARNLKTRVFGLERGDPSVYNTTADLRNDAISFLEGLKKLDGRFTFDSKNIDAYLKRASNTNYLDEECFRIAENINLKIKPFTYGNRLKDFFPVKNGIGCQQEILTILATGNVVPCCLAYGEMARMGNIKEEPLKMILERNTGWLNNIRNGSSLPPSCQRCLGAPTRRGVFFRKLKYAIKRK